jgi:hypothetical protein
MWRHNTVGGTEPIIELLEALRYRLPAEPATSSETSLLRKLLQLWRRWLRPFVGTGEGDGWLDQLDDAARTLARDRLPEWLPEAVAALCWLAVQPGSGHRERVVRFQSVLAAAFSHDLLEPTNTTAQYLSAVTGRTVTPAEVDSQLLRTVDYIDDALWCSRTAEELALDELNLQTHPGAPMVRLDIHGITNPLLDPRIPRLVVLVRRYRRCDRVALFAGDASWRLSFATGETIAYLPDRDASTLESTSPLAAGVLESLAGSAGVLADLLPNAEQVA